MFEVASCIACHKLNGVGKEFGPDLTKLDPKQQSPIEILHDIIEPSFRINEKYFQYKFETEVGQVDHGPDPEGDAGDACEGRSRTRWRRPSR